MQADGAALVALLVQTKRRLIAVLVEVRNLQTGSRCRGESRTTKKFSRWRDRIVDGGFAARQPDELPGTRGGKRTFPRAGRLAGKANTPRTETENSAMAWSGQAISMNFTKAITSSR